MEKTEVPLLEIERMYKHFAGNPVLKGVDLTLKAGEIFAVAGGNGAGKSTLMKIITGLYKPDDGKMRVKGKAVSFTNTHEAHLHGIYLVPQEPLIFPNMSVEENIMIGMPENRAKCKKKIKIILEKLGWKLNIQRSALTLTIAEKQLVEIIRGLVREAEVLILDEPTSTLTFGEIDSLFINIKRLANEGMGVLYITHRFSEIFTLADSVAVLRDGVISLRGPVKQFTYEKLVEGLVSQTPPKEKNREKQKLLLKQTTTTNQVALEVTNLTGNRFEGISFQLFPGEVLGVAGVVGAGRTELAEAIVGLEKILAGKVVLNERDITNDSFRRRLNAGLVYVPEDRHAHGIFPITSIKNNITSTILHRLKGILFPFQEERALAVSYLADLQIKAESIDQELKNLSGGNQQKVVLAKYLAAHPKVVILDEPTRGIDAHARNDIYRMIHQLKVNGLAVLLITSDMEEIQQLSNRVLVMHEGSMVTILTENDITLEEITSYAFGVQSGVK